MVPVYPSDFIMSTFLKNKKQIWSILIKVFKVEICLSNVFLKIAGYKGKLFSNLKLKGTKKKVLELGVGTGPNFKYYVDNSDLSIIIGVDPNKQMEKYARSSAATAGLPASNFNFLRGVQFFLLFGISSFYNWNLNQAIGKRLRIFFFNFACLHR